METAAAATAAMATTVVGFGTAGLGSQCYAVVMMALELGFRAFDTAEADLWYDQGAVGKALQDFFSSDFVAVHNKEEECVDPSTGDFCSTAATTTTCASENLKISTKIPPWSLTSADDIRQHAAASRKELVGFCDNDDDLGDKGQTVFPLDIYYIHAPACWRGWHPRCDNPPSTLLDLRSAWLAMEQVVGLDHSAERIGLSNVHPPELLDIIHFVKERQATVYDDPNTSDTIIAPPPRMPDVLQAYADPIQPADELRRICQEHGIEFVSYSTLGTQHGRPQGQNPVLNSPIVEKLAQKHNRSTAEVVLSWALQKGMSIIPRSSQRQHIAELTRLLPPNMPFLDADDMRQMDSLKNSA